MKANITQSPGRIRLAVIMFGVLSSAGVHAETAAVPVVVDVVRSAAVDTLQVASATVHSREQLLLRASVAGRLEWIREAGERVVAGDELARIDTQPLRLQREERRARIVRGEVALKNLEQQLQRYTELQASDYYALVELDDLRAQRDLARADLDIVRAQLRQLDDQLQRATLRAAFPGVVAQQERYAGEEVSVGEALLRVVNPAAIELRAQLPLAWLTQLKPGGVLQARANGQDVLGTVRSLIPDGNVQSQTFEARLDLPSVDLSYWPLGQLAEVRIPAALLAQALLVPRDAIILRREASYVLKIDESQHAQQVPVELGSGSGSWIVVTGALQAGDKVAVRGAERLEAGQSVQIIRDLSLATDGVQVVQPGPS